MSRSGSSSSSSRAMIRSHPNHNHVVSTSIPDSVTVYESEQNPNQIGMRLTATAADHVAAYINYHRIVGDDDGGKCFTEDEFKAYKERVKEARKNRLYVVWQNMNGMDCRNVGPQSICFCGHRYIEHHTDRVDTREISCKQCACSLYSYLPKRGTQDVKCHCKHSYEVHRVNGTRTCKQASCSCSGFTTSLSCACGLSYAQHHTIFESREQRIARGRPVDNLAHGGELYQAQGGITNFVSLLDGVDTQHLTQVDPTTGLPVHVAPVRSKLSEEDEFALYAAKYEKKGNRLRSTSSPASQPHPQAQLPTRQQTSTQPSTSTSQPSHTSALSLLKSKHSLGRGSSSSKSSISSSSPPYSQAPSQSQSQSQLQPQFQSQSESYTQADPEADIIASLTSQIASTSLSQVQRYALNKQLQMARATQIRRQRQAQAQPQQYY